MVYPLIYLGIGLALAIAAAWGAIDWRREIGAFFIIALATAFLWPMFLFFIGLELAQKHTGHWFR